jgi:hypothetical protein
MKRVVPHNRIDSGVLKTISNMSLSLKLGPQKLTIPVNHNLIGSELIGWMIHLWFEVRPPHSAENIHIFEVFETGSLVASYAEHVKTYLRPGYLMGEAPTAYHLYQYPSGSAIVEEDV